MSQSIKQRLGAVESHPAVGPIRKLLESILVDLGVLRTPAAALVTDYTAGRAEVAKLVTDITATRAEVVKLVTDIAVHQTLMNNRVTSSAGLAIASGKKTATCGNSFTFIANGTAGLKAAGDCSALVGTCADAKACAWVFYISSAGTITTSSKTADVSTAALALADAIALAVPANLAVIGYLTIINSGASFIGGTTDLDAGTVTDVYYNIMGPDKASAAMTAVAPAAVTAVAPAAVSSVTPAALTLTA